MAVIGPYDENAKAIKKQTYEKRQLQKQIKKLPFTRLTGPANVLIFPNLESGNVAYKLMRELGGVPAVGPVLLGMPRPVSVLERDCSVDSIVWMSALTVVEAQSLV